MAIVNEISQCHNSGLSVLSRESVISHLPYVNMHVCKCVSVHLCTDLFACHQNGSLERTLKLRLWRLLTEPVVKEVKKKKSSRVWEGHGVLAGARSWFPSLEPQK